MAFSLFFFSLAALCFLTAAAPVEKDDTVSLKRLLDELLTLKTVVSREETPVKQVKIQVEAPLRNQMDLYAHEFEKGNIENLYDNIFMANAVILPPGKPKVESKAAFIELMKGIKHHGIIGGEDVTESIDVTGSTAIQVTHFNIEGNENEATSGSALTIWQKEPVTGIWKIAYNIWNTR